MSFEVLVFLVILALLFDFMNGFHDAANSIATIVSTRALSPHWAVLWAAFFNFISFLVFGLAPVGSLFLAGIAGVALWGVATPSFQSLMSHRVDATEQGQLQGALGSIRALTGMIGPLLFTQVFAAAVGLERVQLLGAPFLLSAALLAAALAIGWRVLPRAQAPGP